MSTSKVVAEHLVRSGAYLTGEFLLKDGTVQPDFVDVGRITGRNLYFLAELITRELYSFRPLDVIVAPPYKAIPLAATVSALADLPFDFYRKEVKAYGEQGLWVTKAISASHLVLVIDDVLTSGITKREVLYHIWTAGAIPIGILAIVDRTDGEIRTIDGVPTYSLTTLSEICSVYKSKSGEARQFSHLVQLF
ncbi:MAG: phosphoribosyltransferase family protein [Candidatus Methanomethylicaceae archaeon]